MAVSEKTTDFGTYIRARREALGLSLRGAAAELGVTAAYLCDIERGNRYAPERYLAAMERLLRIPREERDEFYDLAGKNRLDGYPDLKEYIDTTDIARVALRRARDYRISERQWQEFIDSMEKSGGN